MGEIEATPDDEGPEASAEENELSLEELEAESAGALADRHAMSVIDSNVTIPANPALAADVLADTLEESVDPEEDR